MISYQYKIIKNIPYENVKNINYSHRELIKKGCILRCNLLFIE